MENFRRARLVRAFIFLTALLSAPVCLSAGETTRNGVMLAEKLDAMDVENNWLPGVKVRWEDGGPRKDSPPGKTHCSAFVSAACKRLGAHILSPPEHGQNGLANAQCDWLASEGSEYGWEPVSTPFEAQKLANNGMFVVVVYKNPKPEKPGHIAIVRPSEKSRAEIESDGPQIIQAGGQNASSISLKDGFKGHSFAWTNSEKYRVRFYAFPLEWPAT